MAVAFARDDYARSWIPRYANTAKAAKMPMTTMTTSSSTSVKPLAVLAVLGFRTVPTLEAPFYGKISTSRGICDLRLVSN